MPSCRGVFFDLVGTLIDADGGIGHQYAALARRDGLTLDPAIVERALPQALRAAPLENWGAGASREDIAMREKISWRKAVERIVIDAHQPPADPVPEFDHYFETLYAHFCTRDAWLVHADVVPCLEALLMRGYVVGMITNFDLRVHALLDNLGLSALFDSVTVPADACAMKPDAAIFSFALGRHSLAPDEVVFVGDSPGDDVEGSARAGLRPVLVDRRNAHADLANVARINSLESLPSVL